MMRQRTADILLAAAFVALCGGLAWHAVVLWNEKPDLAIFLLKLFQPFTDIV